MGQGCQTVNEVVGHVQKLKLIGSGGECGAHDEVHLHGGEHGAQGVELCPELSVCAPVLHVQVGEESVIGLLDGVMQRLIGRDDALALAIHVPSQFFQERSEENDTVSQGVLQFFD